MNFNKNIEQLNSVARLQVVPRIAGVTIMQILFCAIFLFAFRQMGLAQTESQVPKFVKAKKDFPREETNLRKWDAPTIADLDQDGYPDLILNEHGLGIRICWNNKGKFAKPYDLIMGDLHGVSVGDYDMDGNLELILSRGGGSGSNARNSKIYRVDRERNFTEVPDFKVPLELMRGRTVKFYDGDNDGDLDLVNFAFPDKEKEGASENYLYKNEAGEMILNGTLPASNQNGQKVLVTDFDGDNVLDLLLYGDKKVKAFKGKGDLTYKEVTGKIFPKDIEGVTSIVELDYDNDGDFDLFFTRGKEFEIGETFFDKDTKTFGFFTKRGKFKFEDLETGDILNMENFQSQWPDNDAFYIGETGYDYEFPGETHSGKDIRLVNSDALGFPDKMFDRGWHIGYIGNRKWRIAGSLWAPATGVVRGVESYPESEHPKGKHDILLENKGGKFKDVTKKANLFLEDHTVSSTVADFDNNGFQDLLVVRRGDLIHDNESFLFLNQGDSRFDKVENHQIVTTELGAIGMCLGTIDYNLDGKPDVVIGNERGKWHLFKNTLKNSNKNQSLTVEVGNSKSGKATALGALVTVEFCGQKQVKRVGATGANYSLDFNPFVHFGLGDCGQSVKVKVKWSDGQVEEMTATASSEKVFLGKKNG